MKTVDAEVIRVLEAVGHLEAADQLREELSMQNANDESVKVARNLLIFVIAKTMEKEVCARAAFPCESCLFQARKMIPVITDLMERVAVHAFINIAKENDIRKLVVFAIKHAINSVKKTLIGNSLIPLDWNLPKKLGMSTQPSIPPAPSKEWQPRATKPVSEETLKIVRISEKNND